MAKVSKKSKMRLVILGPFAVLAIVYFFITLIGYIVSYSSLKIEEKKLNESLLELQQKKANLKIEIVKLNDPSYVARYAKENYLYSSDGEYVIKIDNNDTDITANKDSNYLIYYIIGGCALITIVILVKRKSSK